ncbi:hypothetical protein SEA_THUMB_17 [Mycobacterium phage Thumb]|nr:hypothetical protein SEA_THUMB_17 [Mycobacterium phage Thumb]
MADDAAVAAVLNQLPDEADVFGVDADYVGILLDSGLTETKVILSAWRAIAAKSSTMTNVSESGSSRDLSSIFDNARQMIDVWQARADAEDKDLITDNGKARARVHTARRAEQRGLAFPDSLRG